MADETSLREDLEAASESVEDNAEEAAVEVESAATEEAEGQTSEAQEEVSEKDGEKPLLDAEPAAEAAAPVAEAKAPLDWSDEVKAKWSELPKDVQDTILNRERHVNDVLQKSADARNAVSQFEQMISPYTPLMQAEGVTDPMQAINGLLQTTAALSLGSPAQKAQKIANLIAHYGVDIQTLDSVLAGEPAQDPQQTQLEQMLNQRLAPVDQLLQRVNQAEQQSQQQLAQENAQTIEQFASDPKNVHFEAVREVMADFLDMAAAHNQGMTLEQAYERACMAVPEVAQQVMAQRAQGVAGQQAQTLAGKTAAAASVHGQSGPAATAGIEEGSSMREALEQAAGLHQGGRI